MRSSNDQLLNELSSARNTIGLLNAKVSNKDKQLNEVQFRISQMWKDFDSMSQQIKDCKFKISLLEKENKQKTIFSQINQKIYLQQKQKNNILQRTILQVQQQAKNAKLFRDKAFQEQLGKKMKQIKRLQKKVQDLTCQNQRLLIDNKILLENNMNRTSKPSDFQLDQMRKIDDLQIRLFQFMKKQEAWTGQKICLQSSLSSRQNEFKKLTKNMAQLQLLLTQKQEENKRLTKKINQLQLQLQEANKKVTQLQRVPDVFDFDKKGLSLYQQTQSSDISTKTINHDIEKQFIEPTQSRMKNEEYPITDTSLGLNSPFLYVQKIAFQANIPPQKIFLQIGHYFLLHHQNISIDMEDFINYDWSLLKEANFFNTKFDIKKWKIMVQNASLFPNLQNIYLHGNSITIVQNQDLKKFNKLEMVYFHHTDETRWYKEVNTYNPQN